MITKRRIVIAFDVLLAVIVVGLLYQRALPQAMAAMDLGSGDEPAPPFTLATLDGDSVSLDSLRGNVVLINFWATWCGPCRVEMPGFERVYRAHRDDGFIILGIATDAHARDQIRAFVAERGITYPILLGTPQIAEQYGGVNAIPESFLVDRNGRIRHRIVGYFAEPALRAAVGSMVDGRGATP